MDSLVLRGLLVVQEGEVERGERNADFAEAWLETRHWMVRVWLIVHPYTQRESVDSITTYFR